MLFSGSLSDLQILRNVLGEPPAKLGHTCAEVDDAAWDQSEGTLDAASLGN